MLHGSQEWGGKGLGNAKMKHEKGFWALYGSQEWGGKGFGMQKMKHEKGLGVFLMVPKNSC